MRYISRIFETGCYKGFVKQHEADIRQIYDSQYLFIDSVYTDWDIKAQSNHRKSSSMGSGNYQNVSAVKNYSS